MALPRPPDDGPFRGEPSRAKPRRRSWGWWATLVGPWLLLGLLAAAAGLLRGARYAVHLLAALAAMLAVGKLTILAGADGGPPAARSLLTAEELCLLSLGLDLAVACTLAFHLEFLHRLPGLGPKLAALVGEGQRLVESQPWLRRATLAGVALFVALPLAGSGAVGGSILGRLLGLGRAATILGVALGGLASAAAAYLAAEALQELLQRDRPWLLAGGGIVLLAIAWGLRRRFRRVMRHSSAAER